MARKTRLRPREPYRPKPVAKAELSEKHVKLRVVLVVLLILIGVSGIGMGVFFLLNTEAGWQEIQVSAGEIHCGGDFSFLYRLGEGEVSAVEEKRAVTALYSNACVKAYRLFDSREGDGDAANLADLNARPNEELEVDPALYEALGTVTESGDRTLYLAPAYDRYNGMFDCIEDSQAVDFDPLESGEVAAEFAEAARWAGDPAAVDVELLGENRVRLKVSAEYAAWAEENGVERYVDWGWTRNAFVIDYLAAVLTEAGFTRGCLSSYDGFVRNLDGSGEEYSLSVYDKDGDAVYPAALMAYTGPVSLVSLHSYPLTERDQDRYYMYRDGEIRPPFLDPSDGLPRTALSDLVCYARDKSCAQVLLGALPVYLKESFGEEDADRLQEAGLYAVYCESGTVFCRDPSVRFRNLYEEDGVRYRTASEGETSHG